MGKYDFGGWATRNDLVCSDGRTIKKDAFKDQDGVTVPIVWNHDHNSVNAVLGHAVLENREDGVYAYGVFNNTEEGQHAKELVKHGDVRSLSIYANKLKHAGSNVVHGIIRELSLVLAGANPGATIDWAIAHGDGEEDAFVANYDIAGLVLYHSDDKAEKEKTVEDNKDTKTPEQSEGKSDDDKTVEDVYNTLNDDQKKVVDYLVGLAASGADNNDNKEGDGEMGTIKHNVFDQAEMSEGTALTHSDEVAIISEAKKTSVGSFREALKNYVAAHKDTLAHGAFTNEDVEQLFPEFELVDKGEPNTLERDQTWVASVMSKIHKSPISRIRTRNADARKRALAQGYQKKGDHKTLTNQIKLVGRTTDPQTVYIKDELQRDDIVDITDFDVVSYQWKLMRHALDETLALAALVGDGRDDGDPDKIHEDHVRSIWNDDDFYCIKQDIDIAAEKAKLQGTDTSVNFGDSYIYAEAVVEAALFSREKFKGSGTPDYYCTPHALNVMLLARDRNGRRIYNSKADLAAALNVNEIHTVEQFGGLVRVDDGGKKHKLLGIFVNLADYTFGATKGGEVTKFDDFDINFNQYLYLLETRISGSLTKPYSAIALEEPVA